MLSIDDSVYVEHGIPIGNAGVATRRRTSLGDHCASEGLMVSNIEASLRRYHALRKHADEEFRQHAQRVEDWKTQRLRECYADLTRRRGSEELMNYYFSRIYAGVDLSEFQNVEFATRVVEKVFTSTSMLQAALEFNALSGEINQAITHYVYDQTGQSVMDENLYLDACHACDLLPLLSRQIDQFEVFADDLNETVNNRSIRAAIKYAKVPAKLGNFSKIYSLVADGVAALDTVDNPEGLVSEFVGYERQRFRRLGSRERPLFRLPS